MTRPMRLRRSELSTPGSSDKMMAKAAASEADLVFLDLEDAVAPSAKVAARGAIVNALLQLDWGSKTRAVRINGLDTVWCHDDLIDVVTGAGAAIDVIIVPKVKAPRDVWFVETLLGQLEAKLGLEPGRIGLEILIEEAEALARVEEIAGCSARLEALILGFGDLSASQGIRAGHVGGLEAALSGGHVALRPQPDDRGRPRQRPRRDRRTERRTSGTSTTTEPTRPGRRRSVPSANGRSTPVRSRSPTRSSPPPPTRSRTPSESSRPSGTRRRQAPGPPVSTGR